MDGDEAASGRRASLERSGRPPPPPPSLVPRHSCSRPAFDVDVETCSCHVPRVNPVTSPREALSGDRLARSRGGACPFIAPGDVALRRGDLRALDAVRGLLAVRLRALPLPDRLGLDRDRAGRLRAGRAAVRLRDERAIAVDVARRLGPEAGAVGIPRSTGSNDRQHEQHGRESKHRPRSIPCKHR